MQTTKGRGSPKESPQKVSPRPARQLKIGPVEHGSPSPSSHVIARTPKDKSPKVTERKSPRSPIPEKKRPSKLSELESQISKLQNDLKTVKDQLIVSESLKKEAQEDAEDVKRQLADVSSKLEGSQKQLSELCASRDASVIDLHNNSPEEQDWESRVEAVRKDHLDDSASLTSALEEIQRLKLQLEKVHGCEDAQDKEIETTHAEFESLKADLADTISLVETMKQELEQSKESEAQAHILVKETLCQLEAAKETINALRSDVVSSKEVNNSVASELQQSKAQVSFLEEFVNTLKKVHSHGSADSVSDQKSPEDESRNHGNMDTNELQMELETTKSEVRQLKSALEAAEVRFNEERSHNIMQIRGASESVEQLKAQSSLREAELEEELKKASVKIDELKSNLMDKENELQGISEENELLNTKLEKSDSCQIDQELEIEVRKLKEHVADMKASLMDKETELQNVLEENEMLKLEINKREVDNGFQANQIAAEVEASRAAEQEAMTKVGYMMEEVDKSNRKAVRVAEQLQAAQAANAEMEAELRRLKVQSDQWRKAAEAAASMLSPGSNGKYVERTGSMPLDGKYSPVGGRINSPYLDDYDDDSFKKKNGNVLKKFLWKKPQK